MATNQELIEQIEKTGKAFQGKQELIRYYKGQRLTLSEAVKAHCYDCMGYFDNGAEDCEIPQCPLYPFAPYTPSSLRAPKKRLSEEVRAKLRENLKKTKRGGSKRNAQAPGK